MSQKRRKTLEIHGQNFEYLKQRALKVQYLSLLKESCGQDFGENRRIWRLPLRWTFFH